MPAEARFLAFEASPQDATTAIWLFDSALARISMGGLTGLLNRLRSAGYSDLVAGWTILGERRPIATSSLRLALNPGYVREFAAAAHLSEDLALAIISFSLPDRAITSSARGVNLGQ